jgi:hypothetical protein
LGIDLCRGSLRVREVLIALGYLDQFLFERLPFPKQGNELALTKGDISLLNRRQWRNLSWGLDELVKDDKFFDGGEIFINPGGSAGGSSIAGATVGGSSILGASAGGSSIMGTAAIASVVLESSVDAS